MTAKENISIKIEIKIIVEININIFFSLGENKKKIFFRLIIDFLMI
jgi:hypothetical protein